MTFESASPAWTFCNGQNNFELRATGHDSLTVDFSGWQHFVHTVYDELHCDLPFLSLTGTKILPAVKSADSQFKISKWQHWLVQNFKPAPPFRLEGQKAGNPEKSDRTVNSVIDSTLHHVVLPLFQIAVRRAQKKVQLTQQEWIQSPEFCNEEIWTSRRSKNPPHCTV